MNLNLTRSRRWRLHGHMRVYSRLATASTQAENEFDQELLINLASFLETFVQDTTTDSFAPWASVLLRVVVDRASSMKGVLHCIDWARWLSEQARTAH